MKVKLWWVGARERKERAFFVPFILFEENFFNICVLFQRIVYWIHFRLYILLHIKKHYIIHFCCLLLKLSKAFSVYLRSKTIMMEELFKNISHISKQQKIHFLSQNAFSREGLSSPITLDRSSSGVIMLHSR